MSPVLARPVRRKLVILLATLGLPRLLIAADPPATGASPDALQACAHITPDADRLACYDRLSRRVAPAAAAPTPPTPTAAPAAKAAVAPSGTGAAGAAAARVATPTAAVAAGAATVAGAPGASAAAAPAAASTGAAATASPATASKDSFGLYSAEHPQPPPAARTLQAPVLALGKSPGGRMTVSLEGGALWELDEPDALLAVGDVVTLTRASFGSYLLHTPTKRTYRVHRLQ